MPSFTTGGPARQAFGGPDQRHRARRGNPRCTPENPRAWRTRAESVARAGNTGRAHDLETDRHIDEFRAGRDGAALSQRARR